MTKHQILNQYFGYTEFREGQSEIINNILNGNDILAVMPTGAGKSICYQVPALMLNGITIVISPLISLMKDQVESLHSNGVPVAFLNSSQSLFEFNEVLNMAYAGAFKLIYVAPERLLTPDFIEFAKNTEISMLTVDEAHCISQWGQDFRPSYLKITEFIKKLPYRPIVTAFTATATIEIRKDILKMLELNNPYCITTGFNRENIYFGVEKPTDKFQKLLEIIYRNKGKSGIVYCISRKLTESISSKLCEAGISAACYHAGLSDYERSTNQDDFIFDRIQIIVATNAFGMGIDKSNVSFVVHYNMPKSIESYYQEAGRAGRDGEDAECILFYSNQDVHTNKFFIENQSENSEMTVLKKVAQMKDTLRLKAMTNYCNTTDCLREYILKYFGETSPCHCENCSNCNADMELVDITIETQKIISCIYRLKQRELAFGKHMIVKILTGAKSEKISMYQLETLSTYGIIKNVNDKKCLDIINFLEMKKYISVSEDEYPVLMLNNKSAALLKNKIPVFMPVKKAENKSNTKNIIYNININLMEKLKTLRKDIANKLEVPAYIVFSDASLRDMCVKLPHNRNEFSKVSGVGKIKTDKFSEPFLEILKNEVDERQTAETNDIFRLIIKNKNRIKISDKALKLDELTENIFEQLGVSADKYLLINNIRKWLVANNMICNISKNSFDITEKSEYNGIFKEIKYRKDGSEYFIILYNKIAQKLILDNIEQISEIKS